MLTMEEVAKELRVTVKTVGAWARKKKILGTRIGRRWLFDPGYIEDLKRKHQNADFSADLRRRMARPRVGRMAGF